MTTTLATSSSLEEDQPQTITKSTFRFMSGTFLSRAGGLLRDISMAVCFGATPAIAAFLVAFRFANLLRRIFGEGALLNGFIPYFETSRKVNTKQAALFFRDTFFSLACLLVIVIGSVECALWACLKWTNISSNNQQIILLTMIMLPGLLFICLFSLCAGLLQCEKHFFLTGAAPVAFNAVWIAAVWILKDTAPEQAVVGLSIAMTFAFFLQWLFLFPAVLTFLCRSLSWKEFLGFQLFSSNIRQLVFSVSAGILGVAAAQINSAIDTIFARYASLEGPAYLNFAIHLQQLPLALFGIGLASALLPSLSRAIQSDQHQHYRKLIHFALSVALFFLLPCSVAILVVGGEGVNLILGHGDFTREATIQTTWCLWGYGLGLVPMGIAILLGPAFYAKKDYRTPTIAALFSILINLCLNTLLVFVLDLGTASLALSTSLAACFNTGFLLVKLSQREDLKLFSLLKAFLAKISICIMVCLLATLATQQLFFEEATLVSLLLQTDKTFSRQLTEQLYQFILPSTVFTVFFCLTAWLAKLQDFLEFFWFGSNKIK